MSNVVITGANSGFGLLTARKFAEAGHTVHAGFRSKDRASDLEALATRDEQSWSAERGSVLLYR